MHHPQRHPRDGPHLRRQKVRQPLIEDAAVALWFRAVVRRDRVAVRCGGRVLHRPDRGRGEVVALATGKAIGLIAVSIDVENDLVQVTGMLGIQYLGPS